MTDLNTRPICLPCGRNCDTERKGVLVRLRSDLIAEADLYQCPSCGGRIVAGFSMEYAKRGERYEGMAEALGENRIVYMQREVYL